MKAAVTVAAHNAMTAYFPAAAPTFDAARDTDSQPYRMVRPGWRGEARLPNRDDVIFAASLLDAENENAAEQLGRSLRRHSGRLVG